MTPADIAAMQADMLAGTQVQTWTPDISWIGHDHGLPHMKPAQGGMWVSVSEYNAQAAEIKADAAIAKLTALEGTPK